MFISTLVMFYFFCVIWYENICDSYTLGWSFPGGSDGKESTGNARDLGLIPGLARSPGERNGYPLQSSCLGNPMDRGAWRASPLGPKESAGN